MAGYHKGIVKFIYCCTLVFAMFAVCAGLGCSKGFVTVTSGPKSRWTCDNKADEAMRREDYQVAVELHQRFLEKESGNGLALYHLGYAYGQTGDHVKEILHYKRAIALGFGEESIYFNLGMAYGELNQTEESIQAFKKALDINPKSSDGHFGLALAYQTNSDTKLAEEEFLKAIEIDPDYIDARLYLGMLYADTGDLQKAGDQLRKILEIDPSHEIAREFLEKIEKE
ncbi:MAG: tetratricopeptide repeat protein [Pseudomonadota bacterium]